MKKRKCFVLALFLVLAQVISLLVIVPASASDQGKSYYIHPLAFSLSNDARIVEDDWAGVPSSEEFLLCAGSLNRTEAQTFSASFKAVYKDNGNDTITVYVLLDVKDSTKNNTGSNDKLDGFMFSFVNNGVKVYKDFIHGQASGYVGSGGYWNGWKMSNSEKFNVGVADSTTELAYVAKFSFTMPATTQFAFDIIVQDNIDGQTTSHAASCERFSWNGMTHDIGKAMKAASGAGDCTPEGMCYIVNESAPVSVNTRSGASIRVDTTGANTTGIRFASSIDLARLNALNSAGATITTGTLIVPTENLTRKGISGAFTKADLESAGLTENLHFYDVVNEGNEMLPDINGTWFGTIYGIQDYTREFTAVGYVTVTIDGNTNTYYGTPSASRSIAQVAEAVMTGEIEGDEGNWNSEQETVLKQFYIAEG